MRIDPETCRDPDLLAREVRRLQAVLDETRSAADQADAAYREEIARLRSAIRRLAEQDATLSVCEGAVTVTMDATLTDAEREAIYRASQYLSQNDVFEGMSEDAVTLRGLLDRLGGER